MDMVMRESWARVVCGECRRMVLVGTILALCPVLTIAQRGGGGPHGVPIGAAGTPGSRPEGVDDKDSLKDFHHAMEVQATPQQVEEFRAVMKTTESALEELQVVIRDVARPSDAGQISADAAEVKRVVEKSRTGVKEFVEGFSIKQKAGLKETTGKVEKASGEIGEEQKMLDATADRAGDEGIRAPGRGEVLNKALTNFRNELSSLGLEMGIVLSDGSDVAFKVPPVTSTVKIAGHSVQVAGSTVVSRVSADRGQNIFKMERIDDLSDLTQNLGVILSAEIDKGERCGERVAVHDAQVTASVPVSMVIVQLSYERWMCMGTSGSSEMAEGRATAEIKLTPVVGTNGELKIEPTMGKIEADKFLGDMLRSGDLGADLRQKTAGAVAEAIDAASLKTGLPAAMSGFATMQGAKFDNTRTGELSIVLSGEMKMSDEQAKVLGVQAKATPTAESAGPVLQSRQPQ